MRLTQISWGAVASVRLRARRAPPRRCAVAANAPVRRRYLCTSRAMRHVPPPPSAYLEALASSIAESHGPSASRAAQHAEQGGEHGDVYEDAAGAAGEPGLPAYSYRHPVGSIPRACAELLGGRGAPSKPPDLVYLTTEAEADAALPAPLRNPQTVARAIGLDLEWNMGLRPGRTATMQLSTATCTYVLHLAHMRTIPRTVQAVLEDRAVHKVGVAIRNDARKLQRDFGVHTHGLLELSVLAKALEPSRWAARRRLISLRDLTQTYLERDLRKDAVRVSGWTNVPLSAAQLEYAASDAYVGLELYHELLRRASHTGETDAGLPARVAALLREAAESSALGKAPAVRPAQRPARPKRAAEERRAADEGRPAHRRAFHAFMQEGADFASIAAQSHIRVKSVALYVLKGLAEAGAARGAGAPRSDSPLTAEQRRALRRELARPEFAQVRRLYKRLLVRHGIYSYAEIDAT